MRKIIIAMLVCVAGMALGRDLLTELYARRAGGNGDSILTGLKHFWNPSETLSANDQVGAMNATLVGGLTNGTTGWNMGTSDTDYARLTGSIQNGTNYSVSLWAKPDTSAMAGHTSGGWLVSDREAAVNIDFQFVWNKTYMIFSIADGASGNTLGIATNNATVTDDTWIHLVGVCDSINQKVKIYQNGVKTGETPFTGVAGNASTTNTTFGANSCGSSVGTKYHGEMDKIRFYTNALSDTVIMAIFDAEKGSKGL